MKTFRVRITEHLVKEYDIESETEAEALEEVHENYMNAEEGYVLGADNYKGFNIEVVG